LNDKIIERLAAIRYSDPDNLIERDGGAIYVFFFCVYVLVSNFTVLNMLIGILCEVITRVNEEEGEKAAKEEAAREAAEEASSAGGRAAVTTVAECVLLATVAASSEQREAVQQSNIETLLNLRFSLRGEHPVAQQERLSGLESRLEDLQRPTSAALS